MPDKKIIVSTKDGKVNLDIPGEGTHCDQEMDQIITKMANFIPEERINKTRKTKREVETVNQ